MTSLLNKAAVRLSLLAGLLTGIVFPGRTIAQEIPRATGYVMDNAGLYTPDEKAQLEAALKALSDSTSNEIAIYTTMDLGGYDKSDVALKYMRDNGVGQKKANNGVVILIKPKTAQSKGEAFISIGYGLEGAIPDAVARRVVDNEMIPRFKQGSYFGGTAAAVKTLSKLASGEIKAANYKNKKGNSQGAPAGVIFLVVVAVFIFLALSGNRRYAGRNNLPFWLALGLFNSVGSRHRGSWNDFSGGGNSGGFGGFGGGSGGGGGAGGSW